ncbi:MAG: hypothetical protein QNJ30_10160 [Kiloniellales bacterium]|nr:hypothetical protein [Kiloniellales bacterium]
MAMAELTEREVRGLFSEAGSAEYELDLTGVDEDHARTAIARMVERQRFREDPRSVIVRLDPARAGGGETLFQPVGRQLLDLMKKGCISRCRPLPSADGFFVEMPGRGSEDEDELL